MASAHVRLRAAHASLVDGFPSVAASAAYYAAREIPDEQAQEIVAAAETFVTRVAAMLGE